VGPGRRKLADDVHLRPMDPFYRIRFDDGSWFDYSGDLDRVRAEVARFSPEDVAGFDSFVAEAAVCYRLGFEELGSIAYDTLGDLLRAVPSLMKMRGWRSIYRMAASHLKHPQAAHGDELPPAADRRQPVLGDQRLQPDQHAGAPLGVHWAMGGTGKIIEGMVGLLAAWVANCAECRGGRSRWNPGCQRPWPRRVACVLANGERIAADVVVSNADTMWTYRHLIAPQYRRHWTDRRVDAGRYSMSLFVWYFGTNKRYEDVPHHVMLMGKRYEELLRDIFKRQVLAPDFSLYLHRPTATDPRWRRRAATASTCSAPCRTWAAAPTGRSQSRALPPGHRPGAGRHRAAGLAPAPGDVARDHAAGLSGPPAVLPGAAFGLEPLLLQSAWFRPHNRSEDIDGLFMVGAGTHPGAGVPGVLMSAKALESVLPPVHAARA
jgi:phytoene desaturase